MKIGFPTHPRRDPCEEIAWIAANGFDFVDLFLEPDRGTLDGVDVGAVRAALDRSGLDVIGHSAWYLPIGSPLPQLRKAGVDIFLQYMDLFDRLGIRAVTIHANWPGRLFSAEEGVALQVESLQGIVREARGRGMEILYEPVPTPLDTPENVAAVLDAVPDLKCHLDLGHCQVVDGQPGAMIRRFASRLVHLHAHDNMGDRDLHLPPGTGTIDWEDVFRALAEIGFEGTMTLEVFSPEREYAVLAGEIMRRWIREFGVPH